MDSFSQGYSGLSLLLPLFGYFISTGRMDLFWFMASEGSVYHSRMVLAEQNSLHSDIQGAGRENASVYQVFFPSLYPSQPPANKIVLPTLNASLLLNSLWNFFMETLISKRLLSLIRWTIKTFLG